MLFKITRTKVRLVFWGSFILFMVTVVLPMFFFFYLFDEEQVKQTIIDQFDNKTYDVEIHGGVIPKLWHGMSLDLSGVLLTSKDHKDLMKIRQMSCKLSWLDLVIGRYSVNRIAILGLNINQHNLIHYGGANLLNVLNCKDKFFNIERLKITDINTVGNNVKFLINDGSLIINQTGFGANFNMDFRSNNDTFYSISGDADEFTDNVISFNHLNTHIYNIFSNINLSSRGRGQLNSKHFILDQVSGDFTIRNYVGGLNVNKVDFGLDGANAQDITLQIDFANGLITNHVLLNVDNLSTFGYKSFFINKLHNQYQSDFIRMKFNSDSKVESLVYNESQGIFSNFCSNQINFVAPNIKDGEFNANLIGRCAYYPSNSSFNFGLKGSFNNSPVEIALQFFNDREKPYIIIDGNINRLDLSNLIFSRNKVIPLFRDTNKLPFDWITMLNAKVRLTVGNFVLDRITLSNLSTEFNLLNNNLNIKHIKANIYQGKISGNLNITKVGDSYNMRTNQVITGLSLKDMLSNNMNINAISGTANMQLIANSYGVKNYDDVHKKINGNVIIEAKNGAFQGVDFNLFVNPESMNLSSNRSTIFNKMRARFKFESGISKNGEITFSSPYVIANGGGTLNFTNNTLNYGLNIKSALPKNDQKISSVVIPVIIQGEILSPKISIQKIKLITNRHHYKK